MPKLFVLFNLFICLVCSSGVSAQRGAFLSIDDLRAQAFGSEDISWQTLWINGDQREQITNILGHSFAAMRVRYLGQGRTTLWKFEEIGKEQLITFGVTVTNGAIDDIAVMEYRESRGGEVRYPFFTSQFVGQQLSASGPPKLNGHIDGITGATLSVRAMKKVATLALFCHQLTPFSHRDSN